MSSPFETRCHVGRNQTLLHGSAVQICNSIIKTQKSHLNITPSYVPHQVTKKHELHSYVPRENAQRDQSYSSAIIVSKYQ